MNSGRRCSILDAVIWTSKRYRLVSDKLLAKHRVLPLFRRGKRLFLAVADPTNLHAIDEVKFATQPRHRGDRRRGRQAAEGPRQGPGAGRQPDVLPHGGTRTSTSTAGDHLAARRNSTTRSAAMTLKMPPSCASSSRSCSMHPSRCLGHPFRALREDLSRAPAHGRRAQGESRSPGGAGAELAARLKVMSRLDIAERRGPPGRAASR